MLSGKLPPAVECMVWAYAHGRPPDKLIVEGQRSPMVFLSQYPMGYDPLAGAKTPLAGAKTVGAGDTGPALRAPHAGPEKEPPDPDGEWLVPVRDV